MRCYCILSLTNKYHINITFVRRFKLLKLLIVLSVLTVNTSCAQQKSVCNNSIVKIQVLGSGGPELIANRASSSYLVWVDDKAKVLVDTGGGSSFRYGQSGAQWSDLKAVLFTHFHADHSSDFAAFIKASWFGNRNVNLDIYGPYGNSFMPSAVEFIAAGFGENKGLFKYLSDFYDNQNVKADYKLIPHTIDGQEQTQMLYQANGLSIFAHKVKHGPIPAFAYIIKTCGKTIVFSGDTNGTGFEKLMLNKTDLFVAHNAIPASAGNVAKSLHMTPVQIGEIASHLNTRLLILSHRMNRTLGKEQQTLQDIQQNFNGKIVFADDLDIFKPLDK